MSKEEKEERVRYLLSVNLPEETLDKMEELAIHFGTTKSYVIEIALDRLWDRKEGEGPIE